MVASSAALGTSAVSHVVMKKGTVDRLVQSGKLGATHAPASQEERWNVPATHAAARTTEGSPTRSAISGRRNVTAALATMVAK